MIVSLLRNSRFSALAVLRGTSSVHFLRSASTTATTIPTAEAKPEKSIEELLKEELPQPYDGPERDHVNFPRRARLVYPGKIRMGFIPEEWFQFFYKKTGVTGPYLFGAGLVTFLVSKEIYVIDHEFSTGIAMFLLIYFAIKKFGPATRAFAEKLVAENIKKREDAKAANMKALEDAIALEKKNVWCLEGNSILMDAKRENIHMQLEAEYRKRLMTVYAEVKKRLDYQLDLANTKRQVEQRHMVNWVVDNVLKSITPQQEKEALQKCISDLKTLAVRAAR